MGVIGAANAPEAARCRWSGAEDDAISRRGADAVPSSWGKRGYFVSMSICVVLWSLAS